MKYVSVVSMSKHIQVLNLDVFDLIDNIIINMPSNTTFIYFDPPYVKKGQQLYKSFYEFEGKYSTIKAKMVNYI